jgi:hypothetical protein
VCTLTTWLRAARYATSFLSMSAFSSASFSACRLRPSNMAPISIAIKGTRSRPDYCRLIRSSCRLKRTRSCHNQRRKATKRPAGRMYVMTGATVRSTYSAPTGRPKIDTRAIDATKYATTFLALDIVLVIRWIAPYRPTTAQQATAATASARTHCWASSRW